MHGFDSLSTPGPHRRRGPPPSGSAARRFYQPASQAQGEPMHNRAIQLTVSLFALASSALVACSAAPTDGSSTDETVASDVPAIVDTGVGTENSQGYCEWGWRDNHAPSWSNRNQHCWNDNECKDGNDK